MCEDGIFSDGMCECCGERTWGGRGGIGDGTDDGLGGVSQIVVLDVAIFLGRIGRNLQQYLQLCATTVLKTLADRVLPP